MGTKSGYLRGISDPQLLLSTDLVKLVAEIDEFKGRWAALGQLSPERLTALRKVATVESVGSSTRIGGAKLIDAQIEMLLANRDRVDPSSVNQVIGRMKDGEYLLLSLSQEAFLKVNEDDLFLYPVSEAEEVTVIEFEVCEDGSILLQFPGRRRFVELGDQKQGLRFSARSASEAEAFCVVPVAIKR